MTLILSGTDGLSDVDGSAATPAIRGTDANTGIFFPAADTIAFSEGGVESMRIDSAGNMGLGVTPSAWSGAKGLQVGTLTSIADISGTSLFGCNYYYNGTNNIAIGTSAASRYYQTSGEHYWQTAGAGAAGRTISFTTAMTLDASGNMGLGVTPSAWKSGWKAIQSSTSSFVNNGFNDVYIASNWYFDSAEVGRYIASDFATLYGQVNGQHQWFNAASGTAGNAVSFTQAMTLDTNGRLFVNTTTEPGSNDSAVVIKAGGTSKSRCLSLEAVTTGSVIVQTFRNPNGQVGHIETNASATAYITSSDYRLKEAVQPMTGALAKVALLKPVTYKWKVDGSDGQGFIAHELQEVVPDAVSGAKDATEIQKYEISPAVPATFDEEGNELTSAVEAVMGEREVPSYQGIDTSFLVATLTAAIQELKAIVDAQAVEIASLKGTP